MRILLVNSLFPDLGIGGSEQSTYYLAQGLKKLGHQVAVFSQNIHDRTVIEEGGGVEIIRAAARPGTGPNIFAEPYYQRLAVATQKAYPLDKQLGEYLKTFKPDVVNTAVIGRLTSLWAMIKNNNIPCVHTLRAYSSLCSRRMIVEDEPCLRQCRDCGLARLVGRERSNMVDGVVGISSHILKTHLQSGWFRETPKRVVIANSYEAAAGAAPVGHASGPAAKPYEFGYIGRLHHTKGVELFLEALDALRLETGRPHPTIIAGAGDPSFEWRLRSRFEGENTHFTGYVKPEYFFDRVRYCVVPSIWFEPFGRIFIESLHHGVPVIGSLRGGGSEILDEGGTGWLFEPSTPNLKEALGRASRINDLQYQAMRQATLVSAQNYSILAIARQYEAFYISARETAR